MVFVTHGQIFIPKSSSKWLVLPLGRKIDMLRHYKDPALTNMFFFHVQDTSQCFSFNNLKQLEKDYMIKIRSSPMNI